MYQEYWGLSEAPFDNVPDPGIYFRMHASVENAIAELLFAIEEGNECLALLIGGVGLGKMMALRVVLDKLEHDKYRTAFITNPDLTFPQLMREVIGQLRNEVCQLRSREALLEHFNRFLLEAAEAGQPCASTCRRVSHPGASGFRGSGRRLYRSPDGKGLEYQKCLHKLRDSLRLRVQRRSAQAH